MFTAAIASNLFLKRSLIAMSVLILSDVVQAKVYRCKDAAGNISYSQQACGQAESGSEIHVGQSGQKGAGSKPVDNNTCRQVALMARGLYPSIKGQPDVTRVFNDLGGIDALSSGTVNIINYLASFRYNKTLKTSRVVALTQKRCLRGGFGDISETDLPDWQNINGRHFDPQLRQELIRNKAQNQNQQQIGKVCQKYENMLKIYDTRLSKPMDKLEKEQLQARRDMMQSIRDENCSANQADGVR